LTGSHPSDDRFQLVHSDLSLAIATGPDLSGSGKNNRFQAIAHQQHGHLGMVDVNLLAQVEALRLPGLGLSQGDAEQHQIDRLASLGQVLQDQVAIARFQYHLKVRKAIEPEPYPQTKHRVIVHQDNLQRRKR
jgi:hypothetical protein